MMRVLVAEDHRRLAIALRAGLRREGMSVDLAFDGSEALARTKRIRYDVVVLDRDLPEVHGDQVCEALRCARSEAKVLMLTAASTIADRVEGLGLGADDYLTKPFDFDELVARVKALARRTSAPLPPTLKRGDLVLDPVRRWASRGSRRLALSPKEFAVLEQAIGPDDAARLFEPFQRLGPRRADAGGHHGLGLSIVRAIAVAHGASVKAIAQREGGLAVFVEFALDPSAAGAPTTEAAG